MVARPGDRDQHRGHQRERPAARAGASAGAAPTVTIGPTDVLTDVVLAARARAAGAARWRARRCSARRAFAVAGPGLARGQRLRGVDDPAALVAHRRKLGLQESRQIERPLGQRQIGGDLLEARRHRERARRPQRAVLGHELEQQRRQLGRHVALLEDVGRRLVEDPARDRRAFVAVVQPLARERLVQHHAEREQIRSPVQLLKSQVLGRHVADVALEHADARLLDVVARLGDAEVGDAHQAVETDEQIFRRDVAMHDAQRRALRRDQLVRGVQAARRLRQHRHAERDRQQLLARLDARQHLGQRRAVDVVHQQERAVGVLADLERRGNVGVADQAGQTRLVEEHGTKRRVAAQVRMQPFSREKPRKTALLARDELDVPHPALGDPEDHDVADRLRRCRSHARESYNITTMTLDAADASHWNAVLALAPIDGTAHDDDDSPARAWQSLAHGEAEAMEPRMADLFALASASRDPRLVVEVTALRALVLASLAKTGDALTFARRASLMARTEAEPDAELLANIVLARMRRHVGKPHLAVRILDALARLVPDAPRAWLEWERLLAGGTSPVDALEPDADAAAPASAAARGDGADADHRARAHRPAAAAGRARRRSRRVRARRAAS